jgi:hypothetical protein
MFSRSKKRDFVRFGWFSLHESVLMAGGEIDIGSFIGEVDLDLSKRWLNSDAYQALLAPIIAITNVTIGSPSDDGNQIGKLVWTRIREFNNLQYPRSEAFSRTSLQGFSAAYGYWRAIHPGRKIPAISLRAPLDAATAGWKLVQRGARKKKDIEYLFWGLGILGWVVAIYSDIRICRYCFRWSVPGSPFCFLHTQSNCESGRNGRAYVRYRAGAKLLALAQKRGIQIRFDNPMISQSQRQLLLAQHLFFRLPQNEYANEMKEYLRFSPRVLNSIGGERALFMSDERLLKLVRERLNPMEWFPQALFCQVIFEENILLLEEERKPGRPKVGRNDNLSKTIEKANIMFVNGARVSDVAFALKKKINTVSNWIQRFEDVRRSYEMGREVRISTID